jgi:hypothetical protein
LSQLRAHAHVIAGLLHEKNPLGSFQETKSAGRDELLARTLVMLVAFVPLFAFSETARVVGEGRLRELFLHRRPVKESSK